MIHIKNPIQLGCMRTAGHHLYDVLMALKEEVKPGMTTLDLDRMAEALIRKKGGVPSFLHYEGFPNTLCTSVDDKVVHGIPNAKEVLKEGSILSIDCGLSIEGWHADSALTVPVGKVSSAAAKLIADTERSFFLGAMQAVDGRRLGDIGFAVQDFAEAQGYGVVRDLTGHGIGRDVHEDPNVPNYGEPGRGLRLRRGMVIAIEPMITAGTWQVRQLRDGWTIVTADHSLCSHYEHTVAVGDGLPELLTFPGFDWQNYMKKMGDAT